MSEPTFREATQKDARDIASVAAAVREEMGEEEAGLKGLATPDQVVERMSGDRRAAAFVCGKEEGIYGFALLAPDSREPEAANLGVWILPAYRRRGYGTELALMALERAREAGYKKLRGTLPPDNEPALSFFGEVGSLAQVVGGGMQYELPL